MAFPVFFNAVVADAVVPCFTLLKFSAAGVAISFPTGWAVAVPASATIAVGVFGSSLETVTLPEKLPVVFGEKLRSTTKLPPAGIG